MFGKETIEALTAQIKRANDFAEKVPVADLLSEFSRLNSNLEKIHKDAEHFKPLTKDLQLLISTIRDLIEKSKGTVDLARQIKIFNQIMLQTSKVAGYTGMLQTLLTGIINAIKSKGA